MQNPFCDWTNNMKERNIKGALIMVMFRIASFAKANKLLLILMIPYLILYRVLIEWMLGTEIPYKTIIGKGFVVFHGQATVINDGTRIGENCTIRHCVTIGNKKLRDGGYSACPIIGNNVDIGSNVCIIGPIVIGDNNKIGAGSVVVKDAPVNSTVVGNPGRIITNSE